MPSPKVIPFPSRGKKVAPEGGGGGGGSGGDAGQGRRPLQKGMSGLDVGHCQNLLNRELAFSPPPLWVDGIFGIKTDRKVREFQSKKKLTVDGVVGPETWALLEGGPAGGGLTAVGKGFGGGRTPGWSPTKSFDKL